ncbi:hypothetical protein SAMN02745108_01683 [Fibrobacter intestinalis]|uniref:Uncharacterized protein n=1 Tax=Fibrobacter intestinalis TaxID=28122 RepID=A0A1T4NRQ6_9BACT|nr:hypothetical protein BGW94_2105 [Fibrobacter sp. NR9]SJZ81785.1 hypothetical protein SAMN02745108_01683 [Fibrobacter intestinalis]
MKVNEFTLNREQETAKSKQAKKTPENVRADTRTNPWKLNGSILGTTTYAVIGLRTFVLFYGFEKCRSFQLSNKSKPNKSFSYSHSSTSIYMKKAWG